MRGYVHGKGVFSGKQLESLCHESVKHPSIYSSLAESLRHKGHSKAGTTGIFPLKRQFAKAHTIEEKRRSTPSTPSARTVTLINHAALPRKTTVPIRKLEVAEVISSNRICIRRRIDTVSSSRRANVGTVNLWTQGNHVLMDHATEEGIASYRHRPLAILQQGKKRNG